MPTYPTPTRAEASRFLSHAALGHSSSNIEAVRQQGYEAWITNQFNAWVTTSHWAWLEQQRPELRTSSSANDDPKLVEGATASAWRRFIQGQDLLRQKVTFALSQIVVVSAASDMAGFQEWGAAHHLDVLQRHAFGNYRDLLIEVSKTLMMGYFLTYRGSAKAGQLGHNKPDENYARELMQLFTIGLYRLALDGTPLLHNGEPIPTYTPEDVATLARVFTGWNTAPLPGDTPDSEKLYRYWSLPMANTPSHFDPTTKTFSVNADGMPLMPDITATQANAALIAAVDGLMAHPNIGPFIGRQLIQRLVTSNPSPAYVAHVAAAFNNNGNNVKGDMKAVIRAVLMAPELFDAENRRLGGLTSQTFGKLREPVARVVQWGKVFGVKSKSGRWLIGNSTQLGNLGQKPLRAPSVFNFFRPGYVPPSGSAIADSQTEDGQTMVAPEFQITDEVRVVHYLNELKTLLDTGINGDVVPDYSQWLPKVGNAAALVAELNTILAADQIGPDTIKLITQAVGSMPFATNTDRTNRVKAAAYLVMTAPEYLSLK